MRLIKTFEKYAERVGDKVAHWSGSPYFLLLHIVWWAIWIGAGIEGYPFGLLTMILSLEAILLSGLILSASNRIAEKDRKMMIEEYNLTEETSEIIDRIATDIVKIKQLLNQKSDNLNK